MLHAWIKTMCGMSNATAGLGLGVRVLGLQGLGLRAQREETHLPLKFLSHQMNHCIIIMATSCYEYVLYEFNFSMTGSKKKVVQAETNKQPPSKLLEAICDHKALSTFI